MHKLINNIMAHYRTAERGQRILIRNQLLWPFSLVYVLFNFGVAAYYESSWMLVLCAYYVALLGARAYILLAQRHRVLCPIRLARRAAILLVILGVTFAGFAAIMFSNGYTRQFGPPVAYILAALGFSKMALAIGGLVRARREHSLVLEALKAYGLADGLMAIVTTQYALLTLRDVKYAGMITGSFGLALANGLVLIGIVMIIYIRHKRRFDDGRDPD